MNSPPLSSGPKRIRVYDTASPYALDEYLTETDDVEAFRRRTAPWTHVSELSPEEYRNILRLDERWDGPVFRCFAKCLRHEGISIHSLDREAIERIMRSVDSALDQRRGSRHGRHF